MKINYQCIALFLLCFGISQAQVDVNSELHQTFIKLDSLAFDEGFNNCDLTSLESLLSNDLEFYHDLAGIQNKEGFLKAMKENICSNEDRKPIRKLTPNTLKVYPMYNNGVLYAAIAEGKHEFYMQEKGKELYQTGDALFSGLWVKDGEDWKMKRVYSYHHQGVE
ncbi:MAG: nuclear transport factor 2 family protein [Bacteroidetes bacterium]|nr:nuclear transport factor 2 family protein [Bacteroidota bacterium]